MFRFRYVAAASATILAGGLTLGVLTAAPSFASGAGGNPQPTPTYTTKPPIECPPGTVLVNGRCEPVVVNPVLRQQEFDITDTNALPNGWVLGTGPISIVGGIDRQVSGNPRVDLLESANGANGVRINHEPLSGAVIDRTTCSIKYDQVDLPWSIHQGFGTFAGATGNGFYDLVGLFSFPTRNNRCTLPRYLTSAEADSDLNGTGGNLPQPLADTVAVQAVGQAAVRSVPVPCPTPTRSVFSPVNGDNGGYNNGGTNCPVPTPTRSVFAPVG
jgi:hypothetical protein